MAFSRIATLAALLFCYAIPASAQAVKLEFRDGKVNLTTQNASMRAILTEWARLGGTQVVNSERLAGPPVTLQLTDVPETQALDIILRGTAGYIAGLRPSTEPVGARSALDRILVVPTVGTATTVSVRPGPTPPPFSAPPTARRPIDPDDDQVSDVPNDDSPNRPRNVTPVNVPRPGVVQVAPQPFQPQENEQPAQPASTAAPANPFGIQTGSSRPGVVSPQPQPTEQQRRQPDPEP
jgi:hypothetical protein